MKQRPNLKLPNLTIFPPAPAIVNGRKPNQNFKAYKIERAASNKAIHDRLKGFLVHLSNELLLKDRVPIGMRFKRGKTFIGSTTSLQPV